MIRITNLTYKPTSLTTKDYCESFAKYVEGRFVVYKSHYYEIVDGEYIVDTYNSRIKQAYVEDYLPDLFEFFKDDRWRERCDTSCFVEGFQFKIDNTGFVKRIITECKDMLRVATIPCKETDDFNKFLLKLQKTTNDKNTISTLNMYNHFVATVGTTTWGSHKLVVELRKQGFIVYKNNTLHFKNVIFTGTS